MILHAAMQYLYSKIVQEGLELDISEKTNKA